MTPVSCFFFHILLYRDADKLLKINSGNMKKYILTVFMMVGLSGCDLITPSSSAEKICTEIAHIRLKHPGSYDHISTRETESAQGQLDVKIDFNAWNDFKVPLPHNITCRFQDNKLTAIIWNGRPIRQHELDEIKIKFE
ncbi:hypothetical protein MNBD_ALPHA02-1936 [hydrothermal vent metagenome]|uniref:Uncharacterized protein n=1 Tax=hydrothermal vent metagenome TaxID=652676 RepID=A0A3B0RVA7_9ZZZZ